MTALRFSPLLALALACGACQSNTCPSPGKGPIASFSASPSADLDEAEAWLSMPHPSDHRRDDRGKPDWTDFPDPNRVDLLDDYLDIIAELEEMANVDEDILAVLMPHFDPITFQEVTSNPKIEEYRLDTEELRQWGVRATSIREQILERAQLHLHDDEIP